MKVYDFILWGMVDGEESRCREPVVATLNSTPTLGQIIEKGEIAEVDALEPRFPVEVVGVGDPENPGSESSVHIKERPAFAEPTLATGGSAFSRDL